MEDILANITWQTCTTVLGVALVLSAIILPIAKELGARGRAVLITGLVAGQLLAHVGFALTGGWNPNAILVGLVAAASATGLYEWKAKAAG